MLWCSRATTYGYQKSLYDVEKTSFEVQQRMSVKRYVVFKDAIWCSQSTTYRYQKTLFDVQQRMDIKRSLIDFSVNNVWVSRYVI